MRWLISFLLGWAYFLAACSTPVARGDLTPVEPTFTLTLPPYTPAPTTSVPTHTPQPTRTATRTAAPPTSTPGDVFQVCSPLAGYTLAELPAIISNPYHPPAPGSDDPHQAVDLADRYPGSGMAVPGMPVQAVLAGKVILAQADRFPYGYAVIVETALGMLPETAREAVPKAASLWVPNPALNCPEVPQPDASSGNRSIYVLYAHLQEQPLLQAGETVTCGQVIGAIGQSGNALAPHLHLEVRVGPSGWLPGSLAHYTNDATPDEMGQYCTWRVSGIFQHLDPLSWLNIFSKP